MCQMAVQLDFKSSSCLQSGLYLSEKVAVAASISSARDLKSCL